ncbi:MAG: porin [Alcanivorax sp.]|nr:porin [Alcanivorax sp.]
MKKNLLAIAVGAAVAMPGLALADSPVVYGKVNITLDHFKTDTAATSDKVWKLDSNASRVGVKGSYDLDVANLKAIYQAEFEVHVDGPTGDTLGQRNVFGGLQGSFGTIKAGRFDTPTKSAQGKIDQFNDLQGDLGKIMAGENRLSNIVQYSTPKLGDLVTLNLAFIPGEGTVTNNGDTQNGLADSSSISAVLEKDMFYAAVSHDSDIAAKGFLDSTGDDQLNITRVAAGVKPGNLELGALYQMAKESNGDGKDTSVLVSGAFKIQRVKLKAEYGQTKADLSGEKATQYSLGADYKLAKTSKVFAYGTRRKLDLADAKTTIFGVGLEHKF